MVLFHHDPDRSDDAVAVIERSLQGRDVPDVVAAREGDVFRLP